MKLTKRLLSLLLALAMVCAMVPVGLTVSAEEAAPVTEDIQIPEQTETPDTETSAVDAQIPTIVEKAEIDPWVNPLYEGVIDESALNPHVPTADPDASVQATYVSVSSAGTSLRTSLKNRTESVTLYVSDESYNYAVVLEQVLAIAVEHTGKPQEGDYLNYQVAGFSGTYGRNYVDSMYQYTFELTFTYMTTVAQEHEVAVAVSAQINKLGIRHKSAYEKISAVYQYMCDNITYDYDHLNDPDYLLQFSAYGAIVNKTAVCQGYALLFYRFMLELNVDCRIIVGIGGDAENNGPHAWNIVELDGLYYNMDTTWDAGNDEYDWFMNNSWNFIYHYRDLAFETVEFHTEYPMAAEDYDPDVEAVMDPYIYATLCGDSAVCLLDREGNIIVAGAGAMYDYGSSNDTKPFWRYMWGDFITSVTIDEGITYVGAHTFSNLENLTSITLAEGLEEIGESAFQNSDAITELNLPDSLICIQKSAFSSCDSLTSIEIPGNLTTLGDYAFSGCQGITELYIPKNVTTFGFGVFYGFPALVSVTFDDSCTTLGEAMFAECIALTNVTLPGSWTDGGTRAFERCRSLERIVLPDSLTVVPESVFAECFALTDVTLPAEVVTIDSYAFSKCYALSSITFPDTLTEISSYAFEQTGLTELDFPTSLTTIGYYSFYYCNQLTEVYIPESVTSLSGFSGCNKLERAYLYNVGTIGYYAFTGCQKLSYIEIGDKVTGFGINSFSNCDALTELVISENIVDVESSAFYDCDGLKSVYLYNTGSVGGYAFYGCDALETFVIGENVKSLGGAALQRCTALPELTIPANITEMGFLSGNTSLSKITFLGDAPKFDYYSFSGITATVYYPSGNDTWTEDIMQDYSGHITWVVDCAHEYESVVTAPTCTEQGYTTYTCTLCGYSYVGDYTDTIPHTPGEVQVENEVAATCTEKGSYDNVTYCTECGAEASRETVETETIPHTYSPVVTEPTCTEQGYTTHTCTVCGDSYADTYVSALGHTYDNYTLTTKPTQTSTGALTGTCTVCGGTTTIVLPMLNEEDYTYVVTLEPTDDENGAATYTWNITDYGTIIIEVKLRKLTGLPTGDLNDDGEVDIFDANLIVAYYNGTAELDVDQLAAADVNGDGEVDIFDANLVVSHYNGTIDIFPVDE